MNVTTKKVKLTEIKVNQDNPRQITKKAMELLSKSLKEFPEMLELREIVVDDEMVILGGNMRYRALELSGAKTCIAKIVTGLTPAQKREFIIKDNAAFGEWDIDKLANAWSDLPLHDWGVDLPNGWTEPEVNGAMDETPKIDIIKEGVLADLQPTELERKAFDGRKILIEYSGGKDSSAAAVWAKQFFPEAEIELMFSDMGADFTSLETFLHDFAVALGAELKMLRSDVGMLNFMLSKGKWPHFMHPYCHKVLHDTLDHYVVAQDSNSIIIVRGGRAQEKARIGKRNADRFLKVNRLEKYTYFQPLYFSSKELGLKIIEDSHCPVWQGYSTGLMRTCCRICPGQRAAHYYAIREKYQDVWQELLWLERRFGPGCWQDPFNSNASASVEKLAERHEAKLDRDDLDVVAVQEPGS
jgi:3'-phosphoadenosine 5'-phosphosulfate sulfotransferase (PAPS reductase)/FAD synthetase